MFYKAKVAVCSDIRTKHINAMWAPRRIFLVLNLVVCKVTARLWKVNVIFDSPSSLKLFTWKNIYHENKY
jgi:hypothetical protein